MSAYEDYMRELVERVAEQGRYIDKLKVAIKLISESLEIHNETLKDHDRRITRLEEK